MAAFPQREFNLNSAIHDAIDIPAFEFIREVVTSARALRTDNKIDPKAEIGGWILSSDEVVIARVNQHADLIRALAGVVLTANPEQSVRKVGGSRSTTKYEIYLDLPDSHVELARTRLQKEIADLNRVIDSSNKQLGSPKFVTRAPLLVVEQMKEKLAEYEAQLEKSKRALAELT